MWVGHDDNSVTRERVVDVFGEMRSVSSFLEKYLRPTAGYRKHVDNTGHPLITVYGFMEA
uniref:Uncharacterized protein n=1 Tax=uncultured crenarchaeote TaxID=29281 RepID=H5SNP5_9CREN|nr:hypothetical protein HGMM_F52D10C10 [uncultured crenarchaeote]